MRNLIVWGSICGLLATSACAQEPSNDAVAKAIALTRETTETYSLFSWNIITLPGKPTQQEWAAEFHHGILHRVETPRDRIVADCVAMTGSYLRIDSGEILRGPHIARAACGIQANSKILESRITGEHNGEYGRTRTVLVRDPENVRTYDIADSGALVAATIDDLESNRLLKMYAIALSDTVPERIFSEESLAHSAVPDRYKAAPSQ